MSLANNTAALLWLQQFNTKDQPLAKRMLENFFFISSQQFAENLESLIRTKFSKRSTVALFVEREIPNTRGKLPRKMYKEQKIRSGKGNPIRLRATGAAQHAVESTTNNVQDVGSEGIVAWLLSQLHRGERKRFVMNPSAEEIRKRKIRHIAIVTDFIGSGNRAFRMLHSLWQVKSVKSWYSGDLIKFSVLAYSGTKGGIARVKRHPLKPRIAVVSECPTIRNNFKLSERKAIITLCEKNSPVTKDKLGYENTGALIAFAHSCPNNVPAIFHKSNTSKRKPWYPLFPSRVAKEVAKFDAALSAEDRNILALETLKFDFILSSAEFVASEEKQKNMIIVMAAVRRGHRETHELVTVTGKSIQELSQAIEAAQVHELLDRNCYLTAQGFALLKKLNSAEKITCTSTIAKKEKVPYYPNSLRVPL